MMNALVAFTEAEGGSAVPFPPPRNLVEWAPFFGDGTAFEFNKIALISLIAFLVPTVIFIMARGGSADHPQSSGYWPRASLNSSKNRSLSPVSVTAMSRTCRF